MVSESEWANFWCFDCGVELTVAEIDKQVKDNGVFSGKCATCLDQNGVK